MEFANAFASMFMSSLKSSGTSSFVSQRLLNLALEEIEKLSQDKKSVKMPSFWGELTITVQILACTRWSAILKPQHQALLVHTLMSSLLLLYPRQENEELNSMLTLPDVVEFIELILAGVLKMWTSKSHEQKDIQLYRSNIIVAMIRILTQEKENQLGYGIQALALQILCTIVSTSDGQNMAQLSKFQPALISLLRGMLDHPSSTCRQMIVETIHCWSFLE
jgi:hypothetical protein